MQRSRQEERVRGTLKRTEQDGKSLFSWIFAVASGLKQALAEGVAGGAFLAVSVV
jgi:hypothetical protein